MDEKNDRKNEEKDERKREKKNEGKDDEKEIVVSLWRLEYARRRLMQPFFLQLGLTPGQGQPRILRALLKYGPMSQRQLADRCGLDVTTMSRVLDRMEEAGLLTRQVNPQRRRSFRIVLTDLGTDKARQVTDAFCGLDARLWEGFSPEEREQMEKGLERMIENLADDEVRSSRLPW